MLDVICGKTKPAAGKVLCWDGLEITRKREYEIARLGVGRNFKRRRYFQT